MIFPIIFLYLIASFILSKTLPFGGIQASLGIPEQSILIVQAICYIVIFITMLILYQILKEKPLTSENISKWHYKTYKLSKKKVFYIILCLHVLGSAFFINTPVSDDVNRYVWEGVCLLDGINSYELSPLASSNIIIEKRPNMKSIYDGMSFYQEKTAIYGPFFILTCALMSIISPTLFMYSVFTFLISILLIYLIYRLLCSIKIHPASMVFLVCNPLFLVFGIGEAHNDVFMSCFIVGSLLALRSKKIPLACLLIGTAACIKITMLIFLPLFFKRKYIFSWIFIFIPFILYLPFLLSYSSPFDSLIFFGQFAEFNNGFFYLLKLLTGDLARIISLLIFLLLVFHICITASTNYSLVFGISLAFIFLTPILHPWYLILPIVLNVYRGSLTLLAFSFLPVTLLPHYHQYLTTGIWEPNYFLDTVNAGIILSVFLIDLFIYRFKTVYPLNKTTNNTNINTIPSLSIIIPTLNADKYLQKALDALYNSILYAKENFSNQLINNFRCEILFIDGGSTDNTKTIIKNYKQYPVSLFHSKQIGRGQQISEGVNHAASEVIVVLHSDVFLTKESILKISNKMTNPFIVGGSLSMQFRKKNFITQILYFLNTLKKIIYGISFGDQTQFFRKDIFVNTTSKLPEVPLMEDIEISFILNERGKVIDIRESPIVSSDKWIKKGYKRVIYILFIFYSYLSLRFFSVEYSKKITQKLYQSYYKN